LFAVGDLKDNLAPMQLGQDGDIGSPEPNHEDVFMQAPVGGNMFRGYRILGRDERPQGGQELYAMGEGDDNLLEIALDMGTSEGFETDDRKLLNARNQQLRHVSPLLDFYRPSNRLPSSRGLGKARGDLPRTRSIGHSRVDNARYTRSSGIRKVSSTIRPPVRPSSRAPAITVSRQPVTSHLATVDDVSRPVVKWREYRTQDGPIAGPSNEVFLTATDLTVARRCEEVRDREEQRLEAEARYQMDARLNYRRFQG